MLISAILIAISATVAYYNVVDAQGLNDPLMQYIEGRLAGRRIFWCPSGYGYLAYCPQPTDFDNYNWCCNFPYIEGSWKPSCCPFAVPTGAVVVFIIASITLVALLVFLCCWCCWFCPLYKQLYDYDDE